MFLSVAILAVSRSDSRHLPSMLSLRVGGHAVPTPTPAQLARSVRAASHAAKRISANCSAVAISAAKAATEASTVGGGASGGHGGIIVFGHDGVAGGRR